MSSLPEKRRLRFKKTSLKEEEERTWHWSYTAMLLGWFIGIVTIYVIGLITVLNMYDFTRIIAFFCLSGLLIPLRFYRKYLSIDKLEVVFFNIMGVGPIIFSFLLLLNFFTAGPHRIETYEIVAKEALDSSLHGGKTFYRVTLEDDALERYPTLRRIDPVEHNFYPANTNRMNFEFSTGIIGWDILHGKEGTIK